MTDLDAIPDYESLPDSGDGYDLYDDPYDIDRSEFDLP